MPLDRKQLRRVLALLYPRETDQRRIVTDAGLPEAAFGFEASADNTWFNILRRVNNAQLDALLGHVLEEYPDHEALTKLTEVEAAQPRIAASLPLALEAAAPSTLAYALDQQPWHGPLPKVKVASAEELKKCRGMVDVFLLTATPTEKNAVLRRMQPLALGNSITKGTAGASTYYVGRFGEHRVAMTMCQMGAIGSGSSKDAVRNGISFWRPRAVIMVGVAFGRDSANQAIADVLVSSQIISYAEQRAGSRTHNRGPIAEASALLLDRFRNADYWSFRRPDGTPCQVRHGPVLSGEELIDNVERKNELFDAFPQAIGGEMEGRGLYGAAHDAKVDWVLVKAICDWADGAKHKLNQPLAAAAAVDIVHLVLSDPGALAALPKARKN